MSFGTTGSLPAIRCGEVAAEDARSSLTGRDCCQLVPNSATESAGWHSATTLGSGLEFVRERSAVAECQIVAVVKSRSAAGFSGGLVIMRRRESIRLPPHGHARVASRHVHFYGAFDPGRTWEGQGRKTAGWTRAGGKKPRNCGHLGRGASREGNLLHTRTLRLIGSLSC